MSEEDLKSVLAKYQQKAFELFNQNIVLETQIEKLNASINSLNVELDKLKKSKKVVKVEDEFA
jgi:dynactin complex subunit